MSYDYDGSLRLTRELHVDDQGLTVRTIEYSYDGAGNRTGRVVDGVGETYGNDSSSAYLLSSVTGASGTDTFDYDAGGRLKTLTRDGTTQVLSYNGSGRLTAVDSTTYAYDGTGQRIGADDGTTQTSYAVAPSAQSLGVEIGLRYLEVTGSDTSAWVYAGENPIARLNPDGTMSYYLEDAMDSVIGLTDASGATTESYSYDAFGNLLSGSATPDVGYHGAWHDATGLIDMRARAYDPKTGRFTSVDPVEPTPEAYETFHPYAFANQNPLVYSDPTGGFSLVEINVTQATQTVVNGIQQVAIQYARQEIKNRLQEAAANLLVSTAFASVLPVPQNLLETTHTFLRSRDKTGAAGGAFESLITNSVCGFFGHIFPRSIMERAHFGAAIATDGEPLGNGVGCQQGIIPNIPSGGGYAKSFANPDFVFRRNPPREPGPRAWLVGEIKLTVNTLYDAYVDPGNKANQWNAMANYAKDYGYRIVLFVAFKKVDERGSAVFEEHLLKEGVEDGVMVLVASADF